MGNPDFQLIKELPREIEIIPHKIYEIPQFRLSGVRLTHIGVYNGRHSYYKSSHPADFKGCGKKSKSFYKIPHNASHFVFQNCIGNLGNPTGFKAGRPTFLEGVKTHEFYTSPFPGHPAFAT